MELFGGMGYEVVYGPYVERDLKNPLYDDVLETGMEQRDWAVKFCMC